MGRVVSLGAEEVEKEMSRPRVNSPSLIADAFGAFFSLLPKESYESRSSSVLTWTLVET